MDITFHARNTSIDESFRETVRQKVDHAGRVFEHITRVDVELSEAHNHRRNDGRYHLELTGAAGGQVVRIAADAATPGAALDDAVERFTHQLRRHKERMIDSHRRTNQEPVADDEPEPEDTEVVRTKQFLMKPMSVNEAALQMDMLGHAFFFFHNAATENASVLYRRRDGRLGLIEPA